MHHDVLWCRCFTFFNSPSYSCLCSALPPHHCGLSNAHWLHRHHWHRHHWHRHHWHHRTSASPVSPRVAIPTFVFTYIIVACRSKSSSPPSSLAIYLFAFADPPPALLSAPSSLAYCPLLVLAAAVTYCICWAHPTLAPTVLTVTALLQLLLKLLLRSWLHWFLWLRCWLISWLRHALADCTGCTHIHAHSTCSGIYMYQYATRSSSCIQRASGLYFWYPYSRAPRVSVCFFVFFCVFNSAMCF